MIPQPTPPERPDDWLDHLLREEAVRAPHLDDAGFCARVLEALPPVRQRRSATWLLPLAAVLGTALGMQALGGAEFVFDAVAALVTEGRFGQAQVTVLAAVGVLYAIAFGGAWADN